MRRFLTLGLLLLLGAGSTHAQQDALLEPEKAFAFTAVAAAPDRIEARWDIADGYYMYRDKFHFELQADGVRLGEPVYPPSKSKDDEFFGRMEIYENAVVVSLPLERLAEHSREVVLRAQGQGCNEPIGVCYPPLTQEVGLKLAAAAAGGGDAPGSAASAVAELEKLLGGFAEEPEFLDPEEAFRVEVRARGNGVSAHFDIADGYYLYRDKLGFEPRTQAVRLGELRLPPGTAKEDEFFGMTEVYYEQAVIDIPLERPGASPVSLALDVSYQGCAERGICYPPITKAFTVALPALVSDAQAAETDAGAAGVRQAALTERAFLGYVTAAFGTGLLLTFTPCVLPLIPILSSIIVGQRGRMTRLRGGVLSIAYVLGTAVTYTAVGVVAGATGDQLQAYFQSAWTIAVVSTLFAAMAASMFGLYEVQMPSFLQSRLQRQTDYLRGGSLGVVFALGIVSALIVGACVSPLLISALGVALAKGDPVLGGAIMFSMALGMGVILVAIGFGAGFLLPKAGLWMERVKQTFGVLLLAVAIYLLGTIPEVPVLLLWGVLLIVTAVYLGATQALPEGANGWRYLWKGMGTVMLVWGVLALVGGLLGNRDLFDPVPQMATMGVGTGASTATATAGNGELFHAVATVSELESRLGEARAAGKPVILDYYADWCIDCVRMERGTFQHPRVNRELRGRFVLLQVDVTDPNDAEAREIKRRFGVFGPPAMLFFDASGREVRDLRLYGYRGPDEFLQILSQAGA